LTGSTKAWNHGTMELQLEPDRQGGIIAGIDDDIVYFEYQTLKLK